VYDSTAATYPADRLLVNGPGGKAVEHNQKRCINQGRRGIIALNIEWFGFGELGAEGNSHNNVRLLDLAGVNGLGLFYLDMRRGLDYLYNDADVIDRALGYRTVRCWMADDYAELARYAGWTRCSGSPLQLHDHRHRTSELHRRRSGAERQ